LWYLDDAWLDQMDAKLEQEPVKKSGKKEKTEKKSN
jgi:hypothetical protein